MDVLYQSSQVPIIVAKVRLVSRIEKVSHALLPQIEHGSVASQQPLHKSRESDGADSDRQMKMVAHQAIGDDPRSCFDLEARNKAKKRLTVGVVGIDRAAVHASRHRVINGTVEMYSGCSSHHYSYD
jgi:hypothetical protein